MAGGSGSRLWPMSRRKQPKQLFEILSNRKMIEDTYLRFVSDYPNDKIYIATCAEYVEDIIQLFQQIPVSNIIVEPSRRDTCAAMGFTAMKIFLLSPDEPIVFVPSDHFIANNEKFLSCIARAQELIVDTQKMVDIGVTPTSPNTALGYTKIGRKHSESNGVEAYHFLAHKEKPQYALACEYVQSSEYLWHASFYMWTPRLFLKAFETYAPNIYTSLVQIKDAIIANDYTKISEIYAGMDKISFDYAITEKMNKDDVLIIKGDFGWSDIGQWDVLYNKLAESKQTTLTHDSHGNIFKGDVALLESDNCLIYGMQKKLIATIGLSDMVIVDTHDALLICPKGKSLQVKKIVEMLTERNYQDYLREKFL